MQWVILFAAIALFTKIQAKEDVVKTKVEDVQEKIAEYLEDPCRTHKCKSGHQCAVDEDNSPMCICATACPPEIKPLAVCSTQNETYATECELDRERCMCHRGLEDCKEKKHKHAHLDYYGECKVIPECTDEQMAIFPSRMSDWLFQVMEELAKRKDLPEYAEALAKKAKDQPADQRTTIPVVWKFCELDFTKDKAVTRRELLPLTSMLKPLEHCVAPFLDKCAGDDKEITLEEWGTCLGLSEKAIQEFNDVCDKIESNFSQ